MSQAVGCRGLGLVLTAIPDSLVLWIWRHVRDQGASRTKAAYGKRPVGRFRNDGCTSGGKLPDT